MHDIDTTRLEFEGEQAWETPEAFEQTAGAAGLANEMEGTLDEGEVEELAAELLEVGSEAELDHFIGGLLRTLRKKAGGAVNRLLASSGRSVFGALKGLAKQALPFVGGALGSAIPIPGVGTSVGAALGRVAADALETELESQSAEDREFEMAQRFVRLADEAVVTASRRPARNPNAALVHSLRRALIRMHAQLRRSHQRRPCPPCPPCPPPVAPPAGAAGAGSDAGGSVGSADVGAGSVTGDGSGASNDPVSEWELEGEALERRMRQRASRRRSGRRVPDDADDGDDDGDEWEFEGETLESVSASSSPGRARSGRWIRRGRKIVLLGV